MRSAASAPDAPAVSHAAMAATLEPAQYLTFMLDREVFAIGILSVKEIIEYGNVTSVPLMPAGIRGVINLRGAVVPVMDLCARFGRPGTAVTKRTCIVIVEVENDGRSRDMGVIVDAVNEVIELPASDIEPPPDFGTRVGAEFLLGMGKVRGRFVIVLNVDRVLAVDGADALNESGSVASAQM